MFGQEDLDVEQAELMVIEALKEATTNPDLDVEEGSDPFLEQDLGVDEICMSDLVVALQREFGIQVSDEDAEDWVTFKDVVLGMMSLHSNHVEEDFDVETYDQDE